MGYRIHCAEVYQVKYRATDHFCNKTEAINKLLYDQCPEITWDGEDISCSERLEVPRAELATLIGRIVNNPTYFEKWRDTWGIAESLNEIICIIACWIAESDQRNDYVVLSWY
jgi:hypothetical protein